MHHIYSLKHVIGIFNYIASSSTAQDNNVQVVLHCIGFLLT